MESSDGKASQHEKSESVRVAVNIRPLIEHELIVGCTDCVTVVPGEPQVQIGAHSFTYDYVYGGLGSPSAEIYDDCVAPLVEAIFQGYNATVLAYGQTGSGKTYTMGTNYTGDANNSGIIPRVMENIFKKVSEMRNCSEFFIRVSFIEIFKEEVFDLLDANSSKQPATPRTPIHIRETPSGGITLAGVTEAEVNSAEEMASYLARGSILRATGSTNMNSQSSRSHAIFTINVEQKRHPKESISGPADNEDYEDVIFSKFHLVDLAGSERAKRTGADGLRLKEGIHINRGLLALGNVISALGDEKRRKDGGHVPYRDSKLTRLLQDSLGGNSKTVMIACVSPADTNAEETINTLKYANRARNIQNKAVVNHDPVAAQMQKLRNEVENLQSELLFWRNGGVPSDELQVLRHRITLLEASNSELHQELKERQLSCERLAQRAIDAQVERDELILKIESSRCGKQWNEIDGSDKMQEVDLIRSYVSKIQDLEAELLRLQSFSRSGRGLMDALDADDDDLRSKDSIHDLSCASNDDLAVLSGDVESDVEELEHKKMQEKFDKELQELDKQLLQKEAEMKRFSKGDTSVLKQHYEKKICDLENEKKALQKEIEDLNSNIANLSSVSGDGTQKLKDEYFQKLTILESQVSDLKKKQEAQSQLLRQKQKSDEASKKLQEEIQRIKAQKVHLQHKIKQESEQNRAWKASREKEVLQLKKEGRRTEYEMHKLLALNQRQKMVLQRKTEEAAVATKKLKDLLEAKKTSSREYSANGAANGQTSQALIQAINHELEVILQVHEVRSKYEKQVEARTAMANELIRLKEEAERIKHQKMANGCGPGLSPSARNSRISALENMLASSSSTLVTMASHLSEAGERERLLNGKTRWTQVRSLGEAKSLLNYLFGIASSSTCEVQDKHAACVEKDHLANELKEKVIRVTSLLRQSESDKTHLEQKLQMLEKTFGSLGDDGRAYSFRTAPRKSQLLSGSARQSTYLVDMDTAESSSEDSDAALSDDQDWVESNKKRVAARPTRPKGLPRPSSERSSPDDEVPATEPSVEESSLACCSCSKSSSCKTQKCECRAEGKSCGSGCGCVASKCANRAKEEDAASLASQGALLLQGAFSDGQRPPRKPLSDIGNTSANAEAAKLKRRKNWRKPVIQLVPEPPSEEESNPAAPHPEEENISTDLVIRLPRAMAAPLAERNSSIPVSSTDGKAPPKPPRQLRDEKENNHI